jgi:hypothetical protein
MHRFINGKQYLFLWNAIYRKPMEKHDYPGWQKDVREEDCMTGEPDDCGDPTEAGLSRTVIFGETNSGNADIAKNAREGT